MDTTGQVKFVDLTDDELRAAVGALHEHVKRLGEAKEGDAEIARLTLELKELKAQRYDEDIKAAKRRLSAARKVASLRGITFTMPKIEDDHE